MRVTFTSFTCSGTPKDVYEKLNANREKNIIDTVLKYTKIKEPVTKGKLRWHGVRLCFLSGKPNTYWLEQRGVKIGPTFEQMVKI